MASFSVRFLGCKVSQTDAQALRERLVRDGHDEVEGAGDVAVVNTCCVTNEGLAKSRQAAARAARSHARVYVTGCGARLSETAFAGLPGNVTVVPGQIEQAVETVAGDVGAIACVQAAARLDRVRAFVKIQDGCSFSCAFCVIPLVRGATRSRSADAVLTEIRRRVAQGHREIVLTGVNLGCFRDRAAGMTLAGLIRAAGAIEGVERLRLSSIEINHVDDDLVAALHETPVVGPHLHVPLQSGDDGVLRAMARRYTVETYLRKLEPLADFNLTADVIVGFPAEDDAAFERTLETVRAARLTQGARLPVLASPGDADRRRRHRAARGEEGAQRPPPRALGRSLPEAVGGEGRPRGRRPRRPPRAAATAPTTRPGSSTRRSESSCTSAGRRSPRRGFSLPDDCLFCSLAREGDHVAKADGFVAIRDINPQAETHLLVLPERHVDTFRDIGAFPAEEAKRMLEFVAEVAREAGLTDYRVVVNVGPGGGQTIFHLHWHVLGGKITRMPE